MDPEMKSLIDEANRLHTDLKGRVAKVEERLAKQGERLGLDADGESKHNLLQMADKVAELEVNLQKMRNARQASALELPTDPREVKEGIRRGTLPFFEDPRDEASFLIRSSKSYRRALNAALRSGGDGFRQLRKEHHAVLTFQAIPDDVAGLIAPEVKAALSAEFEPGAGFLAPPTMEAAIDRFLLEVSPLSELARTVNIGTGSYEGLIRTTNRDTISQRGERQARTENTQTKRYEKRRIDVYESEASPALTQTIIEDSVVDLVAELQADAQEDFAVQEGKHFISGTGVNEPEGLMVSSELKQLASGSATTFTMDALKKLPQELKLGYRVGAHYLLSRSGLTTLMLFRNDSGAGAGTGDYMWQPSTQAGAPSLLNGYPWREMVDMDAVGANAYPVVFGNFQRAYRIVRRRGIRVLRDDLTDKPNVIFFMSKRYGGRVWIGEAAVKLKCATSL